jgi:hypothetical protein
MASKSSYLVSGLAVMAAMIVALPAARGIDASTKQRPTVQVNRDAKGDRLAAQHTIVVKQAPAETARDTLQIAPPSQKRRIMDGCDPMFSPVTMPSMAHVAGRCVG